ncbi:hypothetical protein V491_00498 [Pseudogymnoascus sp. VKM F-3775]|nr:hypothetical protein V491_00498 [Pseudogymnoascus sp. VKM F-3775]
MMDKNDPKACPVQDLSENATNPIFGSIDFYDFDRILAGACTGFVVFVILLHLLNHATHLSEPREQVKYELKIPIYIDPVLVTNFSRIMRVALLVPIYSIISLLCISFPTAEVYLRPWLEVAQANCLASYFLLLCEFVSPHTEGRDLFFATIEIRDKRAARKGPVDGVQWFRRRWIGIFQYPIVALLVAIATCVTQGVGVYCRYGSKPHYAKLWVSIALSNLTIMTYIPPAHYSEHCLRGYCISLRLNGGPEPKGAHAKYQTDHEAIIFLILGSTSALDATDTLTYADKSIGIPALLSCLEMVPISLLMVWAYPVSPYRMRPSTSRNFEGVPTSYQGGFLGIRAFLSMVNPSDTIEGAAFAIKLLTKQVS